RRACRRSTTTRASRRWSPHRSTRSRAPATPRCVARQEPLLASARLRLRDTEQVADRALDALHPPPVLPGVREPRPARRTPGRGSGASPGRDEVAVPPCTRTPRTRGRPSALTLLTRERDDRATRTVKRRRRRLGQIPNWRCLAPRFDSKRRQFASAEVLS